MCTQLNFWEEDAYDFPQSLSEVAYIFRSRQSSRKRAAELLRAGRTDEARNFLKRCIDVTHDMALALIRECRRRNVDCIVAPYEADAQLAYLNLKNMAQIVITEDSDLVLFGCTKVCVPSETYSFV
jgi:exonuclease-1